MNGLQSRTSRSSKFIVLSEKTGLRLGVLPTQEQEGGADTYISVGKGQARNKLRRPTKRSCAKSTSRKNPKLMTAVTMA
jgi:hypothetical protein